MWLACEIFPCQSHFPPTRISLERLVDHNVQVSSSSLLLFSTLSATGYDLWATRISVYTTFHIHHWSLNWNVLLQALASPVVHNFLVNTRLPNKDYPQQTTSKQVVSVIAASQSSSHLSLFFLFSPAWHGAQNVTTVRHSVHGKVPDRVWFKNVLCQQQVSLPQGRSGNMALYYFAPWKDEISLCLKTCLLWWYKGCIVSG